MITISVAKDFSRFPAGRFKTDGAYSGERFRDEFLRPALQKDDVVEVDLDGVAGYGSSFLDEAFGGLVRTNVVAAGDVQTRLRLKATDNSLVTEILSYMTPDYSKAATCIEGGTWPSGLGGTLSRG